MPDADEDEGFTPHEEDFFTLFEAQLVQLRLSSALLSTLMLSGVISRRQAVAIVDYAGQNLRDDHPLKGALESERQMLETLK